MKELQQIYLAAVFVIILIFGFFIGALLQLVSQM